MSFRRPTRIIFSAFDPFDDRPLLSSDYPYDPRACARGEYRTIFKRTAECAKKVWPDVLEGREPRVTVTTVP